MSQADHDELLLAFREHFNGEPDGIWVAPGRINFIGEHTDYNEGFVLPFAIREHVALAAARATGESAVHSLRLGETVRFSARTVAPGDLGGWAGYVAGALWALRTSGYPVTELDLVLGGDLPPGAGLSSSAAVECAVACAATALSGVDLDATSLALEARRAENDFVGAPTGVMDQMASMHGRAGNAVFIDTRSLAVDLVPLDLASHDLALLVIDTATRHALKDSGYAARRATCEAAARTLGVPALRDIALSDLDDALARLDDDEGRKRVRHVVSENDRVLAVVARLQSGADPREIGPQLTASHESLRDDFEVTTAALDLAVESALAGGAYGARMTGGGFGGCVIALTDRTDASQVAAGVRRAFEAAGLHSPTTFQAIPSHGAARVDNE